MRAYMGQVNITGRRHIEGTGGGDGETSVTRVQFLECLMIHPYVSNTAPGMQLFEVLLSICNHG